MNSCDLLENGREALPLPEADAELASTEPDKEPSDEESEEESDEGSEDGSDGNENANEELNEEVEHHKEYLCIGLIGHPNVGKSSLVCLCCFLKL